MDDERRDDGGAQDYRTKPGSGGLISDSEHDIFNADKKPDIDEIDDQPELVNMIQPEDSVRPEMPALHLVSSGSPEAEKRRRKRRKKIERRMKRKKRMKRIQKILFILLVTGVIALIASWLFFSSSVFAVSEIAVNHNTLKSDRHIIKESGIKVGENIFQFEKKEAIKAILAQNPYISDVEISRKLPNKVVITVTEHAPAAAIKYNGMYLILDKNGKVAGEEKTQLTATRLTGVEIKHYEKGEVPIVQNSVVFKESLKLINKVNASGMFFKKLDVSSSLIVHGYFTDDLECAGEAEDIIENLEGIKAIIYDLSQKKTMKGTIYVGDDGYATFSPASSASTGTEKAAGNTEKKESEDSTGKKQENSTSNTSTTTDSSNKNAKTETNKGDVKTDTSKENTGTESAKKNAGSETTMDSSETNSANNNAGTESSKNNSKTENSGNKN